MPHLKILEALDLTVAEWAVMAQEAIGDPTKAAALAELKEKGALKAVHTGRVAREIADERARVAVAADVEKKLGEKHETGPDPPQGLETRLAGFDSRLSALEAVWAGLGALPATITDPAEHETEESEK